MPQVAAIQRASSPDVIRILFLAQIVARMPAVHEHASGRLISVRGDERKAVNRTVCLAMCDKCCLRLGRLAAGQDQQQKCRNMPVRHEI